MADDRSTIPTTGTRTTTSDASAAEAQKAQEAQEAQEGADFLIEPAHALALLRLQTGDHLTDYANTDLTIQRVAQGGFGLVFLGRDAKDGEMGALKTLRPDLLARSTNPKRLSQLFLREALTWVGLPPHANLLRAQFASEINRVLFLLLDYAPLSLRDVLEQPQRVTDARGQAGPPGRLPLNVALSWAQHIAVGLVALHTPDPEHLRTEPLVHRDLKPENVLLTEGGRAKITDFGLAKVVLDAEAAGDSGLAEASNDRAPGQGPAGGGAPTREQNTQSRRYQTQQGVAMGTLAYMAPEQWVDAASAGPPADLYALGIMLAELVTGQHPVLALGHAHTEEQWRAAHFTGTPRALRDVEPQVPAVLETLYQRLLAKRPEQRPTAAEAARMLGEAAVALGEQPYTVPDVYPNTLENQRIFWQSWSNTYSSFGLFRGALKRMERALALDPTHYRTLLNYGNRLQELGRLEEALAAYTTGLANCPATETKWRHLLHAHRASCVSKMGRYAEADADYAAALALMPENTYGWGNRAISQVSWAEAEAAAGWREQEQEHLTLALAYARRAQAVDPQDPRGQQLVNAIEQAIRASGGA